MTRKFNKDHVDDSIFVLAYFGETFEDYAYGARLLGRNFKITITCSQVRLGTQATRLHVSTMIWPSIQNEMELSSKTRPETPEDLVEDVVYSLRLARGHRR